MKRNIGKRITASLRQLNEDMRELQRQMTHKSVYAKAAVRSYARRPKYKKPSDAYGLEYIEY